MRVRRGRFSIAPPVRGASPPSLMRYTPPTTPGLAALLAALLLSTACGRSGGTAEPGGAPTPQRATPPATAPTPSARNTLTPTFDAAPLYRQMGMLARGLPFPLVGRAAFTATATADTTHVIVALSFANAALSFAREADNRFRAGYSVSVVLTRENAVVAQTDATEQLLVGAFRETSRIDESIIHQEILDVTPGRYTLSVAIRDEGSQRSAREQMTITVPRLSEGSFSTPMPIAEVTPRSTLDAVPLLLLNPSGTAVVGRDSVLPIYVEAYGDTTRPVRLVIRSERGRALWSDTVRVQARAGLRSGVVEVPVSRIGIGVAQLTFVRDGGVDSASTFVFVGFGGELPVATYEDMLNFLRFFAAPYRLQRLREASEEERPAAWAAFARETDTQPETPAHEEMRLYFARLLRANARFREEGTPGWLADRGRVFISLGDPDQIVEPQVGDFSRNRQQLWEYRNLNLQLVFYDQTGTGRWRLTQSSEARFEAEFRRRLK